jgi:small-conductance mechanosensitive channel
MNIFERVVAEPLERFCEKILQFLPNFMTFLLLIIVGFVLWAVLRMIFLRLFRAVKLDKHFERFGMEEVLGKGGIREPLSVLLSRIIGWVIMFVFVIIALRALDIPSIERLLEGFFLYLPNVVVAALILFFGYFLSNFLGRAALIGAVNAGIRLSGLIGRSVRLTVFVLAVTMALEQLGIGRDTIIIAFAIVFGGVVLAIALALGLGGKDIAREYLEKKMKGDERRDDIQHL